MKAGYTTLIVLSGALTIGAMAFFHSPRKRIMESNSETVQFNLDVYNSLMSEKSFDLMLADLIRETNDLHSLSWVSWYADKESKCNLVEVLDKKCLELQSRIEDVWVEQIGSRHFRESSRPMLDSESSICSNLAKLKRKCTD